MSSLSVVSRRFKEALAEAALENVTRSNREVTEAGVGLLDRVIRLKRDKNNILSGQPCANMLKRIQNNAAVN